jgi:dihydroorotate dehydrogenase (fumarate)
MTIVPETVRDLTISGAGAIVLPSLLEEQVVRRMIDRGNQPSEAERRVEAAGAAACEDSYNGGIDAYLSSISLLKHYTGIPIIANLNGCTQGKWLNFAREIERSGADAIELSLQTDCSDPGLSANAVEAPLLKAVGMVCDAVSIPVAVKLLPFFTSLPNLAWRLAEAGASGVVLFGREPVWEVYEGDLVATTSWSLSDLGQLQTTLSGLIRLRSGGPGISVAASGGISTAKDVVHAVIAGADIAMVTSEIYRTGPDAIAHILEGIVHYLQRSRLDSFEEFVADRKAHTGGVQARQDQVRPMIRRDAAHDPHPHTIQRQGDRWGHAQRSPLDD